MSKSTDTTDSASSDQTLAPDSDRAATVPKGPVKIFTALNETRFLCFDSNVGNDNSISLTSTFTTLYPTWSFLPVSTTPGQYRIKSLIGDLYMAGADYNIPVYVNQGQGAFATLWEVWDAGDGFVYIFNALRRQVMTIRDDNAPENSLVHLRELDSSRNQKFKLKHILAP